MPDPTNFSEALENILTTSLYWVQEYDQLNAYGHTFEAHQLLIASQHSAPLAKPEDIARLQFNLHLLTRAAKAVRALDMDRRRQEREARKLLKPQKTPRPKPAYINPHGYVDEDEEAPMFADEAPAPLPKPPPDFRGQSRELSL